ncbi:kinase-like domain-containing protein [Kockiozyma suomiensis]|uniref:kinase-like domain-containing protein n=1 Tax=Kockiozyma suomiensis TaxID=1337062 RepID=UPI0033436A78
MDIEAIRQAENSGRLLQPCRYRTGRVLGQGSYSVVKECVLIETGQKFAAKIINKRLMSGREKFVRNEILVLKKISAGHRNILTLVDFFETSNNLYLVTDIAYGGELFDRICSKGSYYESDATALIKSITSAVAYLHAHGIVHRDLKPENLLFRTAEDNDDLLIADFGLSRILDQQKLNILNTTCGTPGYMAPEMIKKTGHGQPVDVWAIGVITYFLLCGYTPFDRDTNAEEMQAIVNGEYDFEPEEYWSEVTDNAKEFIRECLNKDFEKRITAEQCLRHPFLLQSQGKEDETNLLPSLKTNLLQRKYSTTDGMQNKPLKRLAEETIMDGKFSESPEAIRSPASNTSPTDQIPPLLA